MADVELPQDIGTSESERMQALERFYVIHPFWEEGVPLARIARERAIPGRNDSRDMAELQIFYHDAFLCRAICVEMAGQTISLKEIQAARTAQRKTLRDTLADRKLVVEQYIAVHRPPEMHPPEESEPSTPPPPRLKRYGNE